LRIGIGRREGGALDIVGWVLAPFPAEDRPILENVLDRVTCQMECWWADGPGPAMNRFNGAVPGPDPSGTG
jgi:peptidyl-tRNA hydrolase